MDEDEGQKRMQELQMFSFAIGYLPILTPNITIKADLGTARREYISTIDAPNKFRHVGLDQIEAISAINVKGSEVHRMTKEKKDLLNAWNNAHQIIGGDVELEDLGDMMSGQSHRVQLCDTIIAKGDQKYIQTPNYLPKDDVKSKQSARVSKEGGRGVVTGTRGRSKFPKPPLATHPAFLPLKFGAVGSNVAESSLNRRRYLDPTLRHDGDENTPVKKDNFENVAANPPFTKVDRNSHARNRATAVRNRRVVDPE
ncbi:hypothetical protein PAAG_12427 [Paracoccidioides lutzii Pb01]|uniref:Uncharacterized protein n=1 Tax=Paracoccidioides lutzii (strain ATCC MYA-826 / Pb01) TaxID=502779 RepID=A0A0A2VIZ0_PARBA|nr:hypothetical protein PAAG_12427 [Paracoccidioides lutzii Pb01]KGQ00884.1 hypothetical protein PAAG_12427 [Paracoccidioides lutzii Pb01]